MPTPHSHHNAWSALLSADEQTHSARVAAHLRQHIEQGGGWLSFARFMELALYAPGLGYYSAGAHKLGAGGDFITAPEVSPLFSQCLANQLLDALAITGGDVLELGAGTGVMAADILQHMEGMGRLPERYAILEVSADLRARQQALLQQRVPHLLSRVLWLEALPRQFIGVVVANEVLDAMPVSRFVMRQGQAWQLGVALDAQSHFVWQSQPASATLSAAVAQIQQELAQPLPDGYVSEINLALPAWLAGWGDAMTRGVMLFIDYGYERRDYYRAARNTGTLSCFCKQRLHDDPLVNVGLQDITAWVDFTALAEAALASGFSLAGYATQAHFLIGAGLMQLAEQWPSADDAARYRLSQQIQKLTLPGEMGETFKVMALQRDCELSLSGFAFRDLRERL